MTEHDEALLMEWANDGDGSLQRLVRQLKEERDRALAEVMRLKQELSLRSRKR